MYQINLQPRRLLMIAVMIGLCADYLFYGRWLGISLPLFVGMVLASLGWLGRAADLPAKRVDIGIGAAALFFACWVALRDAPFLKLLNVLAVLGLLLLLVSRYRGAVIVQPKHGRLFTRLLVAMAEIGLRPFSVVRRSLGEFSIWRIGAGRIAPLGRGVLLAAPIVLVFTGLLMSADSVFASYMSDLFTFELPFDLEQITKQAILVGLFAWLYAGGVATAFGRSEPSSAFDTVDQIANRSLDALFGPQQDTARLPAEGDTQPLHERKRGVFSLGIIEALTVLLAVDGLFGGFMLVQATYFFGGLDTLDRTGMTYSEYARRGFFELVAVACLSLALLWWLARLTQRDTAQQRWRFNGASGLLILLVLGVLLSAFQRMSLYEQAYGFTRLRLYTHSFMIWLAVVLGMFLLALLFDRTRLFLSGTCVAALLYLGALNVANPDALIVRQNIQRYQAGESLDLHYLTQLSADATPALTNALPLLDEQKREQLTFALNQQHAELIDEMVEQGWPAWTLPRALVLRYANR